MIITIKNDKGETAYDVNNIKDEAKQGEARVIVQKVGTLEAVSYTHLTLPTICSV